jgi:diaminohydroxyphosphoribosylaminopyrimidine deaminase/5-amino-6-(5-phosphoribosylamino)uracil reductase
VAEYFPDGNVERVEPETKEEWHSLLVRLGARGVTCLLIEGGGELAAAAVDAGAVDMVEFHIAPKLLGGRGSRPVLGGNNPDSMEFARKLHNVKVTHYGEDIAISGYLEE